MNKLNICGAYYYRKHEMASGFNFFEDGTFDFFFTYGAVDRFALGTFSIYVDKLLLKSNKEAGKDFLVTNQQKNAGGYALSFKHQNTYLLKNIYCVFTKQEKVFKAISDDNGKVQMDISNCDTIYAQHLLYPDVQTLIKSEDNDNTIFDIDLNVSLEQVSFKGIDFDIIDNNTISCLPNYFMNMPQIHYEKSA